MAFRRLVIILTATGIAHQEWAGDDAAGAPAAGAGESVIDVTDGSYGAGPFVRRQWNGSGFGPYVPPAIRQITAEAFWDRWTDAEAVKLEELAEANTAAGRQVRAFFRAAQFAGAVDLDKPWLTTKLNQLAALMIADGIWANQAAADARIAALLADG